MTPDVREFALDFMSALNCPRSLAVAILLCNEEWDQLRELTTDPDHYETAEEYRRAAGATDLLRKYVDLPNSLDLEALTHAKWVKAERACFDTNRRLYDLFDHNLLLGGPVPQAVTSFIETCRKNVLRLIGSAPPKQVIPVFGPGATVSDRFPYFTVPDKMSSVPTFTTDAWVHCIDWSSTEWARANTVCGFVPRVVRGNVYFTVLKDSGSHRACGKEASINVAYQLPLGKSMRYRLKMAGYDLDKGKEYHMGLARMASITDDEVTIDLKSASDTQCTAFVEGLTPPSWFNELDRLRSHFTVSDGGCKPWPVSSVTGEKAWVKLEKFSSMGNGFTFELMTTLLLAVCLAVQEHRGASGIVSVYGDDIIVPKSISEDVLTALRFFGFEPNPRKTYVKGNFRESCGGDYFLGEGVRPYYLEETPYEPQHWIAVANSIRRFWEQDASGRLGSDLKNCWFRVLDRIPSHIRRCRGPVRLGDIVIHDDERFWTVRWRSCIRWVRVYRPCRYIPVWFDRFAPAAQFAAALYGVTLSGPLAYKGWGDRLVPRDGVLGYKVGWTPSS